jgi:hypothetical protein
METENFAAIDLQSEYRRSLLAMRVAATVLLLLSAAWCWMKYGALQPLVPILERMTPMAIAGKDYTDNITDLALENGDVLLVIVALTQLAALGIVWFYRRSISQVFYSALGGVSCCIVVGGIFDFAILQILTVIITKFSG